MRTLVLATCLLAAVTMGDAQFINNILKSLTSKIFDIKEWIDFHVMFAECTMKLGLSKIVTPELSYCLAEKKNLLDEKGEIMWDQFMFYIKKLIPDENKVAEIEELNEKCNEDNKFEGNRNKKILKIVECRVSIVRFIIQQLIFKK